jgi:hypothetical protein
MGLTVMDLIENDWHCGWVGADKLWEFRANPNRNSSTFREAVKLFKNGYNKDYNDEPVIKIIKGKFPS